MKGRKRTAGFGIAEINLEWQILGRKLPLYQCAQRLRFRPLAAGSAESSSTSKGCIQNETLLKLIRLRSVLQGLPLGHCILDGSAQ